MKREDPAVASLISECLGAGTGCQWCVPFLKELHRQHAEGDPKGDDGEPDLRVSPERYAAERMVYRKSGKRGEEEGDSQGDWQREE